MTEDRADRPESAVRAEDLEPYVTLRYVARLFKILAALMIIMLFGEIITGLMMKGREALYTLIGEATRLLVLSGLLWAGGDIMMLLIDAGHDLRVVKILLGRLTAYQTQTEQKTAISSSVRPSRPVPKNEA